MCARARARMSLCAYVCICVRMRAYACILLDVGKCLRACVGRYLCRKAGMWYVGVAGGYVGM